MDNQRGLLLNSAYLHQEKSMDEVRQSLVLTMELEETRLRAQEQLKIKDQEIAQLKQLLSTAIKERDEAQEKCQKVLYQKLLLQHSAPHSGVSSVEDDPTRGIDSNNGFSSSDSDESVVSPPPPEPEPEADFPTVMINRPLPEKGKLLQAVMKAGPLLQTLLLAGPLPQWRHPPPPLDSYQIPPPPVVIPAALPAGHQDSLIKCGRIMMSRKRGAGEGSDSSSNELLKYQRVVLQ
ncbi:hypothetical protein Salat_0403400 [Sesamum alatum]|uniref:Uncharacterized protein n=1 Tax=Sesamum alatum TaxID=300844 RepID=A0AAE1Z1T3_9LAMI|nr:hypothetical protein Salat_0403400 [Sesamum alatum]